MYPHKLEWYLLTVFCFKALTDHYTVNHEDCLSQTITGLHLDLYSELACSITYIIGSQPEGRDSHSGLLDKSEGLPDDRIKYQMSAATNWVYFHVLY